MSFIAEDFAAIAKAMKPEPARLACARCLDTGWYKPLHAILVLGAENSKFQQCPDCLNPRALPYPAWA